MCVLRTVCVCVCPSNALLVFQVFLCPCSKFSFFSQPIGGGTYLGFCLLSGDHLELACSTSLSFASSSRGAGLHTECVFQTVCLLVSPSCVRAVSLLSSTTKCLACWRGRQEDMSRPCLSVQRFLRILRLGVRLFTRIRRVRNNNGLRYYDSAFRPSLFWLKLLCLTGGRWASWAAARLGRAAAGLRQAAAGPSRRPPTRPRVCAAGAFHAAGNCGSGDTFSERSRGQRPWVL